MNRFWKLMEQSTLTSGVIGIMLCSALSYCAIAQIPVPDYLIAMFSVVITFFFTSKVKDDATRKRTHS